MCTMHIYQGEVKIATREFENFFYIRKVVDTDELSWTADKEPTSIKKPSALQIWVRGASVGAEIHYVLPSWQLIIDGIALERGFYDRNLCLGGRAVELQFCDYRFVCSFPSNKDYPPTKIEDLHPQKQVNWEA